MAIKSVGITSATIVSVNRIFDPQNGPQTEIVYQGFEGAINTIAVSALASGGKSRTYQFQGPVYRANVTWGDLQDGSAEVPQDRWERVTEFAQIDIKFNPKLLAYYFDLAALSLTIKTIKDSIDAGTGLPANSGAIDESLYNLLAMGQTSYEVKRFVLRRRRTISLNYADVAVANAVETVYTTTKLVALFGIPAAVASKLPATPNATPPDCTWAWKERADNSQYIPTANKAEEIKDWVFAAWPTVLIYNLVS